MLLAFLNFAFSGAKIINIFSAALFDFSVCRYAIAALTTPRKIQKQKFFFLFSLFAGFAVVFQRLLYLVKKFLCNHWLMASLMKFAAVKKMPVIKWIFQNMFNRRQGHFLSASCANQAKRKHFALNFC
ncbi:MAG: hypothetical protein A2569_03190 [Candidatus Vogelbacteria bacterium RIFOXYD1_FULL_51_18]|uniref:Uncharacterized protein n=1 Tax=Candidatus Vogelbacteria bacterium RIFOXYD1_FULL_51_18 TaxID=1802440 RepID=A0A1G2QKN7_9BACT|nr:MAG: hypothetical protein A2569_03190 [Candidatus Vogelbacteria bacterium RIFOXYD1_FULL_51_18]